VAVAAGSVLATWAGVWIAKKVTNYARRRRKGSKMKLFHRNLYLSTRCTWFIAELGVESEFELCEDENDLQSVLKSTHRPGELINETCGKRPASHCTENSMGPNAVLVAPHHGYDTSEGEEDEEGFELVKPSADSMSTVPDYDDTASPHDLFPALVVNDEFTMIEGAAICMYLADTYGQFLPDADHKAEYYSWILYSAATFDNIMRNLQEQLVDTPPHDRDSDKLDLALKGFDAFSRALSETLDKRCYICGDKFTAADCVLGFTLWWAYTIEGGALLQEYPVLMNYLQRLKSRRAFQKTFGCEETWRWDKFIPKAFKALRLL